MAEPGGAPPDPGRDTEGVRAVGAKLVLAASVVLGALLSAAESYAPREQDGRAERPMTAIPLDGCVTSECHSDVKGQPVLHGPLYVDACDACHALTDAEQHIFADSREREALCTWCHEVQVPELGSLHEPVGTGECLSCHDPHGGVDRNLMRAGPHEQLCAGCHVDTRSGVRVAHHAEMTGGCLACHDPHASRNQKLLIEEGRDLCLGCHVLVDLQIELLHVAHQPAQRDCLICHDPHATDVPGMLVKDPERLCTGCHEEVRHTIDESSSQHAVVTNERACLNCHDPHASDHSRLLKQETMALCFECHDRTQEREGGGVVMGIKREIDQGRSVHGPVANGDCVTCHQIHGGQHDRLLRAEYATGAYEAFDDQAYSLCFECHDRSLAEHETATAVTSFRNGDRNLHHVHVAQEERGRTCHVCHDPHAGVSAHHIRGSVPFGPSGWELPIAWSMTENGGFCTAACHGTLEYDRVQPVEYPEFPAGQETRWPRPTGEASAPGEGGSSNPDDDDAEEPIRDRKDPSKP